LCELEKTIIAIYKRSLMSRIYSIELKKSRNHSTIQIYSTTAPSSDVKTMMLLSKLAL